MQTIGVIGGDERALRLATYLENEGYEVCTLGLKDRDETRLTLEAADTLLFPYPFSVKNGNVPNLMDLTIDPARILACAASGTRLLAGQGLLEYVVAVQALGKDLSYRQYAEDVVFLEANTDISAEGAVCHAMQLLSCTIRDTACLVTGYGPFAQAIARKLLSLGAVVTVAARKDTARRQARQDGMEAVTIKDIPAIAGGIRVLFNTVPAPLLDTEALAAFPAHAILLELASAPYGFDIKKAEQRGLTAVLLPGIPGKYAPESAAKALLGAVKRLTEGDIT